MTTLRAAIAAAYAIGAVLAFLAVRRTVSHERRFWLGAAFTLLLFAIAKELQLQDVMTCAARGALKAGGWYGRHQEAQWLLAAFLAIAVFAFGAFLISRLRPAAATVKVAAAALWLLTGFILVRAASFHAVDAWVMHEIDGMRLGWWIELGGIFTIGAAALIDLSGRKGSL